MGEKLKKRLKQQKFRSAEHEAYLNLFLAYNYLRQQSDKLFASHGITNAQYNVLRILKGVYPGGHPRCEIITRMIEPAPDVTRIIDKLEKERFVERFNSNEDRRHSIARITKKGLDILEKLQDKIDSINNILIDKLTKEEITLLSSICEKIYEIEE